MTLTNREVRIVSYPEGWPTEANFEMVEVPVRDLRDGDVLIRNIYMSLDPAQRTRMRPGKSYLPAYQLGKALDAGALGRVEQSLHPDFKPGEYVNGSVGWRDYSVTPGRFLTKVDADAAPLSAYMGTLGMTGFTAYVGIVVLGQVQPSETVFVSGAAGAVGTVAGQIAKIHGARVIGSAGTPAKVAYIRDELGFDVAINYHDDLSAALEAACPDGIDLYLDNVGGDHLQAALNTMKLFGRVVVSGMIATYNDATPSPGPSNLFQLVAKRINMRGFLVMDHREQHLARFQKEMSAWVREGRVKGRETITDGLENGVSAFVGMLRGENIGKALVRVSPER
jgi:NADPH-dependent curcumin reductase CurA